MAGRAKVAGATGRSLPRPHPDPGEREKGKAGKAKVGRPRGLHPHELDLAEKGLVGSLKLGKDLGEGGELEAVDPPSLHGVHRHVQEGLALEVHLTVDPEGGPAPEAQAREGLAGNLRSLGPKLGVQLGQALEVLLVEGLQVPLEGVGDGVKLSSRGVEEDRHHPPS